MRYVVSLSSIPPRFGKLGPALASLLNQSIRPLAVELWLPMSYRRFPDWDGRLPDVPEGVTIRRCETDFGPATKVLPAARAWRGTGVELLFCDDDHFFCADWAEQMQAVRSEHPDAALCGQAHHLSELCGIPVPSPRLPRSVKAARYQHQPSYQLRRLVERLAPRPGPRLRLRHRKVARGGYADILAGCGGVAIKPEFLDDLAFDLPPVVWAVDDIWMSGHLERRGIPIWADPRLNQGLCVIEASQTSALMHAEIEGAGRRAANSACVAYMQETYGIWGGLADQST
jgi:hypothetical protein